MKEKERMTFKVRGMNQYHQFYFDNVSHIVCEGAVCTVYRISGESVCFMKSLSFFEKLLLGHPFFRIHHHTIVNMDQIAIVKSEGNHRVAVLRDGTKLNISVRKWKPFKLAFYEKQIWLKEIHLSI